MTLQFCHRGVPLTDAELDSLVGHDLGQAIRTGLIEVVVSADDELRPRLDEFAERHGWTTNEVVVRAWDNLLASLRRQESW
jgi:hypothetical protein